MGGINKNWLIVTLVQKKQMEVCLFLKGNNAFCLCVVCNYLFMVVLHIFWGNYILIMECFVIDEFIA